MRARIEHWLNRVWYQGASGVILLPLSWLYELITAARRSLYASGVMRSFSVDAKVIVVGNITAGGTGKTPFVIWLAQRIRESGVRVAVVSRGYQSQAGHEPLRVNADDTMARAGDEPLLIARRAGVPVYCHPDRVAAARLAVEEGAAVIVTDDGLQHFRLQRDVEIVMIDGSRRFGNERRLPAGPLREPLKRLETVDLLVCSGGGAQAGEVSMSLELGDAMNIKSGERRALLQFAGVPCHAIAGIANPARFFDALADAGIEVTAHAPGDHAVLGPKTLDFSDNAPVLMTEKDAMRCLESAGDLHWAVPATARLSDTDQGRIDTLLASKIGLQMV